MWRRASVCIHLFVETQDCPIEDFGTVSDIFPGREFLRRMANPVATRYEDHAHRRKPGNLSGVVYRTAWQIYARQTGRPCGLAYDAMHGRIAECRRNIVDHCAARLDAFLAARFRTYDVADSQQVFRSCDKCVLAAIHGRRARMIREARRDALPALETHYSLYNADLNFGLIELRTLFDVQFQNRGQRAARNSGIGQV